MRKTAIIILFSLLLGTSPVFAQSSSNSAGGAGSEPPPRVKVNFNARYPDNSGSAQWQQTEEGYQATFNQDSRKVVSNFDENGHWLRSRTELRESDWPANARKYIQENHKPYEYKNGYRYENEKGARYEIDLRSQNKDYRLNFDKEGSFIDENELN